MSEEEISKGKRKLKQHTAKVAAGFIRYHVLVALNEKPLSGSELIENFERNTGGFWKPSPGSIYPLLSFLQNNGCIREFPAENGMKRYELNERGKILLEEQKKVMSDFYETLGIQNASFSDFIPREDTPVFQKAYMRAGKVWQQLGNALQKNYSKEALYEAVKVMDESSEKLERIVKKIVGEKLE